MDQSLDWRFELPGGRVTHVRQLDRADDVERLQLLHERLPSYCENTIGYPPGPAEAHSSLIARPGSSAPEDKVPIGVFDADGSLAAFADLILRFPDESECYVGYVLVDPLCQRRGLGTALLDYCTRVAESSQQRCQRSITDLIATFGEVGECFLAHNGYERVGEPRPYEVNTISSVRFKYIRQVGLDRPRQRHSD